MIEKEGPDWRGKNAEFSPERNLHAGDILLVGHDDGMFLGEECRKLESVRPKETSEIVVAHTRQFTNHTSDALRVICSPIL